MNTVQETIVINISENIELFQEEKPMLENNMRLRLLKTLEDVKTTKFINDREISENQVLSLLNSLDKKFNINKSTDEEDRDIMNFARNLTSRQASSLIEKLRKVSYYNQRLQLSQYIKELVKSNPGLKNELAKAYKEHRVTLKWFEENPQFNFVGAEMLPPSENQLNLVLSMLKVFDVQVALKEREINIDDFITLSTPTKKSSARRWLFDKEGLKNKICEVFNKEDISSFIRRYEGTLQRNFIDQEQQQHLKKLYYQLGMIEQTNPYLIKGIEKKDYNRIVMELEKQVKLNRGADAEAQWDKSFFNKRTTASKRTVARKAIDWTREEELTSELWSLASKVFALCGERVPQEINNLIYYNEKFGGISNYAPLQTDKEVNEFRTRIMEQIKILNKIDKQYSLKTFYFDLSEEAQNILIPGLND